MNRYLFPIYIQLLFAVFSCSGTEKATQKVKSSESTDSCTLDPKHTYEVFVPERITTEKKLPLLVIIDAHGSGKFALSKFKYAAKKYPMVVVASNLVKNGFGNYVAAIKTLIADAQQKYPVTQNTYLAGFSGGARMALGFGVTQPVNGIISCGALANANQILALHCNILSISGTDDFNFIETAQYLFQEQLIPANLKIELINASHGWPDSIELANAVGFIKLSGPADDKFSESDTQIENYSTQQYERINALTESGDLLKASLIARNLTQTIPFSKNSDFEKQYTKLKENPGYLEQLNKLKNCLSLEMKIRQPYIDALTKQDSVWWKNEYGKLNENIKTDTNPFNCDMYRRIKAFWGIACYSLCNQAVSENNMVSLQKIVTIYKMLEPQNPDMNYFSAKYFFNNGNKAVTISNLKEAIKNGYSDISKIRTEFPENILQEVFEGN